MPIRKQLSKNPTNFDHPKEKLNKTIDTNEDHIATQGNSISCLEKSFISWKNSDAVTATMKPETALLSTILLAQCTSLMSSGKHVS